MKIEQENSTWRVSTGKKFDLNFSPNTSTLHECGFQFTTYSLTLSRKKCLRDPYYFAQLNKKVSSQSWFTTVDFEITQCFCLIHASEIYLGVRYHSICGSMQRAHGIHYFVLFFIWSN